MEKQKIDLVEKKRFCRTCGNELKDGQDICLSCGFKPLVGNEFCQECGSETKEKQEVCTSCGFRLKGGSQFAIAEDGMPVNDDFRAFSPYWQNEFKQIQETNETYKGKWNWPAFFFGVFWALSKGLWLPALVAFVLSCATYGSVGLIYSIIFGFRGNYMHYCKVAKRKQTII